MFDIGWQELFILAVLAIVVIGPRDLPRAIRTVTHWIRRARGMARDLQNGLDDVVREAELEDIKKHANAMMSDELDPVNSIARELDMTDEQQEWSKAFDSLKDETDPDRSANAGEKRKLDSAESPADQALAVETTGDVVPEVKKANGNFSD